MANRFTEEIAKEITAEMQWLAEHPLTIGEGNPITRERFEEQARHHNNLERLKQRHQQEDILYRRVKERYLKSTPLSETEFDALWASELRNRTLIEQAERNEAAIAEGVREYLRWM